MTLFGKPIANPPYNLRDLQRVYDTGIRMPLTARHRTEHYEIYEWVKPADGVGFQQFHLRGPGLGDKTFLGTSDECGPQYIWSLEAAFMAGRKEGCNLWLP